jgi:hypothetical protein
MPLRRRRLLSCSPIAFCVVTACAPSDEGLPDAVASADSMGVVAADTVTLGHIGAVALSEASGAAMSRTQPGVVFTINDSGHEPVLFALDTTGGDRGSWRVRDAQNGDWEAVATGPCEPPNGREAAWSCIYIGDTGDNEGKRARVSIYRLAEPRVGASQNETERAERLRFTYEDDTHDVEAIYVASDAAIFLITKRPLEDAKGRLRPALLFRLSASAWGDSSAVAQLVDSLPIVPGSATARTITDASLSPDRRHLAVRTYSQVFVFTIDSATGRPNTTAPHATCNIAAVFDIGEGIAWLDDRGTFLLVNEGERAALHRVRCPIP